MNKKKLLKQLLINLNEFIEDNSIEYDSEINEHTRLIGSLSIFDSMELVTFIIETEEFINDEYNREFQLATENAMSRRSSPFISINSLVSYILELNEK